MAMDCASSNCELQADTVDNRYWPCNERNDITASMLKRAKEAGFKVSFEPERLMSGIGRDTRHLHSRMAAR